VRTHGSIYMAVILTLLPVLLLILQKFAEIQKLGKHVDPHVIQNSWQSLGDLSHSGNYFIVIVHIYILISYIKSTH